jgi:hypothetical protein
MHYDCRHESVRRFRSALAGHSGMNAYREGHAFAVLKSYFDGSGSQKPTAHRNAVTLAGYVAYDATWADFEDGWWKILRTQTPSPAYMHMQEAMQGKKEFSKIKGWDATKVASLLQRLIAFMDDAKWYDRIYSVSCTVDTDDHERAKREGYPVGPVHRICCNLCAGRAFNWQTEVLAKLPPDKIAVVESAEFFFDQNEPFIRHFTTLWNESRRRKRDRPLWWDLVSGVGPLDMRKHPPLQAADMLAWATNRRNGHGDHVALCRGIMHAIDCSEWTLDYEKLIKPHSSITLE